MKGDNNTNPIYRIDSPITEQDYISKDELVVMNCIQNSPLCPNCALPTSLEKVYLEGITGHANQMGAEEIKSELQKLREHDKGNDRRWACVIYLFESLIGVPQQKYGMTSLCYQEFIQKWATSKL
jgi:hypothetical protein